MQTEEIPLVLRMRSFFLEERRRTMAAAAEALGDYYQTDPEMLDWMASAGENSDDDEYTFVARA